MVLTNNEGAFEIQRNMMLLTGMWPTEKPTFIYKVKTVISFIFIIALACTMWMEFFNDFDDFTKISEILYIMVTVTGAIVKQISFYYNFDNLLNLLKLLKDPLFVSYPQELDHYMAKTVKYSSLLANTYRYLVGLCVIFIGLFPLIDHKPLPFPFPYDLGKYRVTMYISVLLCEGVAAWNNCCMDVTCTSLMGIAAAQLDILAEKIENIRTDSERSIEDSSNRDELATKKLKQCIDHHLIIIQLVRYIEDIFTVGLLAQTLTSCIVICNTLFHFVLITMSLQFVMLANYLIIILIQLTIYCWYGNEIITKSEKIGEACYKFKWYDYGNPVRKHVFLIMERSRRPLYITALKLSTLSLTSLASILQWSYSILALLLKMYKKDH